MTVPGSNNASHDDPPISEKSSQDYWAKVPRSVLTDTRLSDRAVRLYAVMDSRTIGESYNIRVDTLAADIGASMRSTERALQELVSVGYVTRQRTRGVSITAVVNSARSAKTSARSATGDVQDPPRVAGTSSSKHLRNKQTNNKGTETQEPETPATAAATSSSRLETYVEAIAVATGVPLQSNRLVLEKVRKIAARGMTPEEAGDAAQTRLLLATGLRDLYNPAGFLAKTILTDLAEGSEAPTEIPGPLTGEKRRPQDYNQMFTRLAASTSLDKRPVIDTPPPPIENLFAAHRCTHGAEEHLCALCKRESTLAEPKSSETRSDAAQRGLAACRAAISESSMSGASQ